MVKVGMVAVGLGLAGLGVGQVSTFISLPTGRATGSGDLDFRLSASQRSGGSGAARWRSSLVLGLGRDWEVGVATGFLGEPVVGLQGSFDLGSGWSLGVGATGVGLEGADFFGIARRGFGRLTVLAGWLEDGYDRGAMGAQWDLSGGWLVRGEWLSGEGGYVAGRFDRVVWEGGTLAFGFVQPSRAGERLVWRMGLTMAVLD